MKDSTAKKYADKGLTRLKLEELYCKKGFSAPEIGPMFGLTEYVVRSLVYHYDIKRSEEEEKLYKSRMSEKYSEKQKSKETQAKKKKTCLERYGNEVWHRSEEGHSTLKKIQNSSEVKEKQRHTFKEKYGSSSIFKSDYFKEHLEEYQEKAKKTSQERYGADFWGRSLEGKAYHVNNWKVQKEKIEKASLEKYGCKDANQNDLIKQKIKDTKKSRYGDENYCNLEKISQTKLQRYGDANYNNMQKNFQTKFERYGDPHYVNRELLRKNFIENHVPDSFKPYYDDKVKSKELLESNSYTYYDLERLFGVSHNFIYYWLLRHDLLYLIKAERSHYEQELRETFSSLGFTITNTRSILPDKTEIDLYNPKLKIGIEFNGDYWHSNLCKDKDYHFKKSLQGQEAGIRIIHIYEYEWNNPRIRPTIESLVNIACGNVKERIYARQCEIREISNQEARPFNEQNHIQGHRNAKITYGLFYEDELVQLMSFSPHQKYEWEIIRGCPGSNNIVVGGVSKLFKHFVKLYNPTQVFSYCDFNKFDGKSYEVLGMKFIGYTGPDKTWLIHGKAVKRNPAKYKKYKEEAEAIIWGAGSKKYLWENK